MTTLHTLYEDEYVSLTIDSKMCVELEVYAKEEGMIYRTLTSSANGALDLATRLMYAVWISNPDLANTRAEQLAQDICSTFNLMNRHKELEES